MDNPPPRFWHTQSMDAVYKTLRASSEGLSDADAAERLLRDGPNTIRTAPPRTIGQMLWAQLSDPMVLILIGASFLSAALGELTEATVIAAIVVINAFIGIVQEKKAQASLDALRTLSTPSARVLRQGEESVIPASQLVPGDVVCLRDGDMVPADMRLIESASLKVQESALTGESVPADKDAQAILPAECPLGDRRNMVYSSSLITYGRGLGIVTGTGMHTEVGTIAGMLNSQSDFDTPLKRKLTSAGKVLTAAGLIICAFILVLGALYGRPFVPQLLTAIALAISIIPEGLPAAATIVMALSVRRMAAKHALIRSLPAAETLGSATVICTDKTGTLTLNQMTVTHLAVNGQFEKGRAVPLEEAISDGHLAYTELILTAALCNDASFDPDRPGKIIGDPTEGALISMAQAFGMDHEGLEDQYPRLYEQPFDSDRKRMTTVHCIDGNIRTCTKGAAEELLPFCTHILTSNGVRLMTDIDRQRIAALSLSMSKEALRVLGFAMRLLPDIPKEGDDVEQDMTFIGLAGMIDPPRLEAAPSIEICRQAGIRTVMITGDHRVTALSIARQLGIYREGDTVLTGVELDNMDDQVLQEKVRYTTVFARVSPADKLRIIGALKSAGEVAAMTGDGVNDSPALKAADIGISMGITGTDAARSASDMVLLDDKFTTISSAIQEGRRIYRNIQKIIRFLLTGNAAEIITLTTASIFNWSAPLLAAHILWVNLSTATLPALALGVDPAEKDVMKRKPITSRTLFEKKLVRSVLFQGALTAAMTLTAYAIGAAVDDHSAGQTMAFCVLSFSQMLRAFTQTSYTGSLLERLRAVNPWLFVSFGVSAFLMAAILLAPPLQELFRISLLTWEQGGIAAGLALVSVVVPVLIGRLKFPLQEVCVKE